MKNIIIVVFAVILLIISRMGYLCVGQGIFSSSDKFDRAGIAGILDAVSITMLLCVMCN